ASRVVLNSVFLHDAVEAGLDAAIVNASKIEPLNRIGEQELKVARDLIYDRREFDGDVCTYDPLTKFTTLFENVKAKSAKKASKGETVEERLKNHIIDGEKIGLEAELTTALETYPALDIINNILLEGMKVVGDLFGSGQMQLPFVLQSAETMKAAVAHLEQFMERVEGQTKGKIVLATVKGDVHDIGKNHVDIILTNNGYTVYNLRIEQLQREQERDEKAAAAVKPKPQPQNLAARSDVKTDNPVPLPPFWGRREVTGIPLDQVFPYINPNALFLGQWGFKKRGLSD